MRCRLSLPLCFLLPLFLLACDGDGGSAADGAGEPDAGVAVDTPVGTDTGEPVDLGAAEDVGEDVLAGEDIETGPVSYVYAPGGEAMPTFPDDYYTVEDATTGTGLQVVMTAETLPWLDSLDSLFRTIYDGLNELDGWGTNAAVVLHFDGPIAALPEGEEETRTNGAVMMVALGEDGPERVPFVPELTTDGSVLLWPMFPLQPKTRHGVVITRELTAADGSAISRPAVMTELLEGEPEDPRLAALAPRYAELLAALDLEPSEVVGALVFTTQSVVDESVAIAADIAARDYSWSTAPVCEAVSNGMRRCEGAAMFQTYRGEDLIVAGTTPVAAREIKVSVWLPDLSVVTPSSAPWPGIVYGHGLVHERGQAKGVARFVVPDGAVVAAIDAPGHGEHPTAPEDESLAMFEFFAANVDTSPLTIDPLRMRDNFRESTYDKLQLLRLLEQNPDIDGDGSDDIDTSRFGYMGESFGGIMSIETAALQGRFEVLGLQLGGARVATMIKEARRFGIFVLMMVPMGGSEDDVLRLFPVLQTVIERGDPANYASYILGDRLPGAGELHPHLLLQLVVDDDTIPEVACRALTRALGLPHVPPRPVPYDGVPLSDEAPVSLNLLDGSRTAGFFQFDRIRRSAGDDIEAASHDYMPSSEEGELQFEHFMDGWLDPATEPEIVDPYVLLETPPL